jgi:hypothetical protein
VAQPVSEPAASEAVDGFLSQISAESLEVLGYFGPEAPAKLNTYATTLEDALIESLQAQSQQAQALQEHIDWANKAVDLMQVSEVERESLVRILTVPQLLSQYTEAFFGPDGPCPVQLPGEQARTRLAEGLIQPDGPLVGQQAGIPLRQFQAQAQMQQPQVPVDGFGRPMAAPMPAPGGTAGLSPADAWSRFQEVAAAEPTKAWQALDAAGPDALRAKIWAVDN